MGGLRNYFGGRTRGIFDCLDVRLKGKGEIHSISWVWG